MDSAPQHPAGAAPDDRFDALYRDYYERVLRYALRRAPPDVAHDVVADTFLVAWRKLDRLPADPLPWLLGTARKALANQRRSARRREALLSELRARERVRVRPDADETLAVGEIFAALGRLPEADQELLTLVAWDGLTVAEAAGVVGRSAAACRVRLHRARRRLAAALARGTDLRAPDDAGRLPETTLAKESSR